MIIYVNAKAGREGNGSKETPFKHINDAAKIAKPGDEVVVAPGTYREYVNPINGGTEDARITYRSEVPLGAVITGAEVVKSWMKYSGNTWMCRINNTLFGNYNPYTTTVFGDWYFAKADRHTGCVWLNDKALYETETLEECIKGEVYPQSWVPEESIYKWYTEQDGDDTLIYANFQGANPNEENVEITVRRECFWPGEYGRNYITVQGFNVNKAATTWAPPAAYQDGMIGPNWSKGWIIEDCEIWGAKCAGICLGKYYDPQNDHYFTAKHLKSPTQMERDAVCRGQYHGWLKENVGSHIIRRNHIHHCEQGGIIGRMGGVFSIIEDNEIHNINNMHELGGAEIAGIKMHAAIDVTYRRNHIHHCTMGIWCDWEAQGTRITQNLLHDNEPPKDAAWLEGGMMSQDLFVEVGHGPCLIDNNLLLSQHSLRIATEGVAMVHNLILGSFTCVGEGTDFVVDGKVQARYTPYHIPHRTEVAGFMTILHGDNRFYNNIFVQNCDPEAILNNDPKENDEVGTHVWDEYPTYEEWIANFDLENSKPDMGALASYHFSHLPVWVDGNAYFNGAKAFKKENHNYINTGDGIFVNLREKDGVYHLDTNLYDCMGSFKDYMINSDVLGEAFEPEERYENTDGTDIVFDRDFLGNHRGIDVIPGPFADGDASTAVIWEFKA
ncbi:MAG: right-handed parallel beta-helix repeat-containing protein [Clostridia bacterium]|nr:right-handed parallel beta-helix repeat-containing protein [Clostridia bacterium]